MVRWIVGGLPRTALFAGDKAIPLGEELMLYNFEPNPKRPSRNAGVEVAITGGFLAGSGSKPLKTWEVKVAIAGTARSTRRTRRSYASIQDVRLRLSRHRWVKGHSGSTMGS